MHCLTARYSSEHRRRRPPLADVYLPAGAGPHKNILLAHGGGFIVGHRRMSAVTNTVQRLVEEGWAVCAFDYRLAFRGGRVSEGVADTLEALTWWRNQAQEYKLDLAATVLLGISAGAALIQLAAPHAGAITKVVNLYGPTDFSAVPGASTGIPQRLLTQTWDQRKWEARTPYKVMNLNLPYLIQAGTQDRIVVPTHAERASAHRRAQGLPITMEWYNAGHGWLRKPDHPVFEQSQENLVRFLNR